MQRSAAFCGGSSALSRKRGNFMKKMMKIGAMACAGVMAMSMAAFADSDTGSNTEAVKIPDGVYAIPTKTDSTMFHVNALDNQNAFLTVKNGQETVTFRLAAQGFDKLYVGSSSEEAEKDTANQIDHQVRRGDSYYFTIPLTKDGKELVKGDTTLSVLGHSVNRQTWYQHTLTLTYTGNEQNLEHVKVTAPAKTSITKVTPKKKAAKVSWKKVTKNGSGYQIQYAYNKKMKSAKTTNIYYSDTTSRTVKNLKSGKTCYFRVRTEHFNGYKSGYSGWSKVKTAKIK